MSIEMETWERTSEAPHDALRGRRSPEAPQGELGPCQVRARTVNPCLRPAAVRILGVPFCTPHAREQEAYFAVGELTGEPALRAGTPERGRLGRVLRAFGMEGGG